MRPTRDFRSASTDNYREFKLAHPEIEIDYTTFKKIIYTWNGFFASHILETGNRLKIPYGLGKLTITRYKPKRYRITKNGDKMLNLPINWLETKKEGKYVYHMNYETDGFSYYWYWNPYDSYMKVPAIWKLEMARVHSRSLVSILKKPNDSRRHLYKQWIFK